jgi:glyoxylase-like metal-dependent hydrolase (beta-lactamase superfamily II)
MDSETFRFKVGAFECIAISDGTFTYPHPAEFLFANAPKEQLNQKLCEHGLQPDQWTGWTSPYICAIIKTPRHRILVDTGAGALGPNTGKLIPNLKAVGIEPEDIDTVILTRAHPDHIGGNMVAKGKPTFTRASFYLWKDEWNYWTSGPKLGD